MIDSHFKLIRQVIYDQKKEHKDREIGKADFKDKKIEKVIVNAINLEFQNDPDLKFDDQNEYTYAKKLKMLEKY